jgi:hypothetical protein
VSPPKRERTNDSHASRTSAGSGPIPAGLTAGTPAGPNRSRRLSDVIFFFFLLFVSASPHSIAATQIAYSGALLFWIAGLVLGRHKLEPQRLVLPLLAYLSLTAISTALSYEPALSWERMKSVALVLIAVLFAQNLRSLRQVKILVALLIGSCVVNVAYTGWQYAAGIGVKLTQVAAGTPLAQAGLQSGDIIQVVNGRRIRDPEEWAQIVTKGDVGSRLRLLVARDAPLHHFAAEVDRRAVAESGLAQPGASIARGRPQRAQGFFSHYETYAEVLMQIGLLAWGLLISSRPARFGTRLLLGLVFLGIAGAIAATLTRAPLAALLLACALVVWLVTGWKVRAVGLVVLALALLASAVWIRQRRGLSLFDRNDPGTQYRLLMWKDGMRLIHDHPFFGVGMDTVKARWQGLGIQAYKRFPLKSHFHSTPIQLAVERGLFALAAWVWLLVAYLILLIQLLRRALTTDWFIRGIILGILGCVSGFVVSSLVHYNLGDSEVAMLFWFFLGIALALERILGTTPTDNIGQLLG